MRWHKSFTMVRGEVGPNCANDIIARPTQDRHTITVHEDFNPCHSLFCRKKEVIPNSDVGSVYLKQSNGKRSQCI